MSESIKNHEATVMRMAGNIAVGLLAHIKREAIGDAQRDGRFGVLASEVAKASVGIARAIVAELKRTAPPDAKETV